MPQHVRTILDRHMQHEHQPAGHMPVLAHTQPGSAGIIVSTVPATPEPTTGMPAVSA
jgi:hypothetical protein